MLSVLPQAEYLDVRRNMPKFASKLKTATEQKRRLEIAQKKKESKTSSKAKRLRTLEQA
jgi:hypothetical protein